MNNLHPDLLATIDDLNANGAPTNQFVEYWQNRSVIDPTSGEIIDIFDMSIPLDQKADAYGWVMEQIEKDKELIRERKKLWDNKLERATLAQEKLKEAISQQMTLTKTDKVKTLETTLYFQERKKVVAPLEDIDLKYCTVEMKVAKVDGYTAAEIMDNFHLPWVVVKKEIQPKYLSEMISSGVAKETTNRTLCKR